MKSIYSQLFKIQERASTISKSISCPKQEPICRLNSPKVSLELSLFPKLSGVSTFCTLTSPAEPGHFPLH